MSNSVIGMLVPFSIYVDILLRQEETYMPLISILWGSSLNSRSSPFGKQFYKNDLITRVFCTTS